MTDADDIVEGLRESLALCDEHDFDTLAFGVRIVRGVVDEIERLRAENEELRERWPNLRAEIERLRAENAQLRHELSDD